MALRSSPAVPRQLSWILVAAGQVPSAWEPYLHASPPDARAAGRRR